MRFVSLTYGGWDMHGNIKGGMRGQLPQFDQAFAALIRDLERSGLLDSTLVMVSTEFGRTPKINAHGRPRPLAEGVQRRPGRRRHQEGLRLRLVRRDRHRAGRRCR